MHSKGRGDICSPVTPAFLRLVLAHLLPSHMTLSCFINLSKPQFPHPQNTNDADPCLAPSAPRYGDG